MKTALTNPYADALVYRIDSADCISYVNATWLEWAQQNGAEAVMPQRVIGRSLWACMTDTAVREIYERMIKLARDGKPTHFNYRSDSPKWRRVFEMIIYRADGGEVEFVSTLVQEERRPPVALLESNRQRDDRSLRVCSWCQRVGLQDQVWLPVEEVVQLLHLAETEPLPRITHGICSSCTDRVSER